MNCTCILDSLGYTYTCTCVYKSNSIDSDQCNVIVRSQNNIVIVADLQVHVYSQFWILQEKEPINGKRMVHCMMEIGSGGREMVSEHTACQMEKEDTRRNTQEAGKMICDMQVFFWTFTQKVYINKSVITIQFYDYNCPK